MQCLLIFDQLNDILYSKCNKNFLQHSLQVAKIQGLVDKDFEGSELNKISSNVIIQLFSPIITSQRLMACQFGNSYTSIQCDDGVNLVFNEYMGYLFVYIAVLPIEKMNKSLGVSMSFVKYLCGPNVPILKSNSARSNLLSSLLDTWFFLHDTDQAVLVEAVEQLMINNDLSSTILKALQEIVDKLQQQTECSKIHALILVRNKFVSLYSSRNAQDLLPSDILFLGVLAQSLTTTSDNFVEKSSKRSSLDSEMCYSLFNSNNETFSVSKNQLNAKYSYEEVINGMHSYVLLLAGNHPYAVYVGYLAENVHIFLLMECGNNLVSLGLNDAFLALNALQSIQLQKDLDGVRHAFEFLDSGMKKIFDGLKKMKNVKIIEMCQKNLQSKWDFLKKKYLEFIKTSDSECFIQIDSSTSRFLDCLKLLLEITCLDDSVLLDFKSFVEASFIAVRNRLTDFSEFLQVKALRNFTLNSRGSLTINKYLEEFPGLVHFIYVDRHLHRLTAPSLDFSFEESAVLTKKQLWSMVDFSRAHLQEGHLSMIWKDTTFNYAYFLWFENLSGSPLKPKIYPTTITKNLPSPGIIAEDFYRRLIEACFPKMSPNKVKCYELFCIHLGLATPSCVLEHSRRLAATIWEVSGIPSNPADFL